MESQDFFSPVYTILGSIFPILWLTLPNPFWSNLILFAYEKRIYRRPVRVPPSHWIMSSLQTWIMSKGIRATSLGEYLMHGEKEKEKWKEIFLIFSFSACSSNFCMTLPRNKINLLLFSLVFLSSENFLTYTYKYKGQRLGQINLQQNHASDMDFSGLPAPAVDLLQSLSTEKQKWIC